MQVYGNKQMFCEVYPIKSKSESDVGASLKRFIAEYGAPEEMVTDGSKEQTGKNARFQAILRQNKIWATVTNTYTPKQNPAETVICELRKRWYRAVFETNCPKCLWNYGLPHFCQTYATNRI